MNPFTPAQILSNRQYVTYNDLQSSLSSSVSSSISSLTNGRLKLSNLLNEDVILPVNIKNLQESVYFGSAYVRTKLALNKIIEGYPIGLSGSTTSSLYLEDIERANDFISQLSNYEFWCMRQLCGETIETSNMTFTAAATAVSVSLSSTITSNSPTIVLPVIVRDGFNFVLPPQGIHNRVTLDNFYQDLLDQETSVAIENIDTLSPFEQILTTAIAFDQGVSYVFKGWSGTGDTQFVFNTYNGLLETYDVRDVFVERKNRHSKIQSLVSPVLFQDDDHNIMERLLESFAVMFDDIKIYIDGLKSLFKNYWGNWERLPKGYLQQLVAHQYGIELFSSENSKITDTLEIRGTYKSQKEITFEFWNRILCSLTYILKTKGTIESIRAATRSYGLPANLIQIYELVSYRSFLTGYYGEPTNHSAGRFRRSAPDSKKAFTSVSAALTASAPSMTVHTKLRLFDDIYGATLSGVSGSIYSIGPLSLSYAYVKDTSAPSTSGYPYLSFILNAGSYSLSTNYAFVERAMKQSPEGYWTVMSGRDSTMMWIDLGFLPSNYDFYEPIITSASATAISLSSTNISITGVVVGSDSNKPSMNINNFYVQRIGRNVNHFRNLVLDEQYLMTPSGYDHNVVAWKFNENINLDVSGRNYLLDAGPSGFTGSPHFVGLSGNPYDYEYDMPSFYNDNIPGFKIQRIEGQATDILSDKNLRVGISLAAPIDEYIHTTFGSRWGELYANPSDFFSSSLSAETRSYYTYSQSEERSNEIFSIAGTRNDVKLGEFLKFINRINGHIGSFFQFVEQIIPASKRLLEKGIIVENPINVRIILNKTGTNLTSIPAQIALIEDTPKTVMQNNSVFPVSVNVQDKIIVDESLFGKFSGEAEARVNGTVGVQSVDISKGNVGTVNAHNDSFGTFGAFFNQTINMDKSEEAVLSQSLMTSIDSKFFYRKSKQPVPQIDYMPHHSINDTTYTLLRDIEKKDSQNLTFKIPNSSISSNSYFLHVVQDAEKLLLSTSVTADQNLKRVTGRIFVLDSFGRKVSTKYDSIRLSMNDAIDDNLNAVNVIMDGEWLPWNEHVKDYPIASASGVSFEINTIGVPLDGSNPNKKILINITNLLNPQEDDQFFEFYLSTSMEDFSSDTGYSLTKTN